MTNTHGDGARSVVSPSLSGLSSIAPKSYPSRATEERHARSGPARAAACCLELGGGVRSRAPLRRSGECTDARARTGAKRLVLSLRERGLVEREQIPRRPLPHV